MDIINISIVTEISFGNPENHVLKQTIERTAAVVLEVYEHFEDKVRIVDEIVDLVKLEITAVNVSN